MKKNKFIFLAKKAGEGLGLANRIWQYSYFLAYTREHNIFLINPTFDEYVKFFNGTRDKYRFLGFDVSKYNDDYLFKLILFLRKSAKWGQRHSKIFRNNILIKSVKKPNPVDMDQEAWNIEVEKNKFIFIEGWRIRCNVLFNKHKKYIKAFFQPISLHKKNVSNLLYPIKSNFDLVIGFHIRRADYGAYYPQYYFSFEQYSEFMNRISQYFKEKNIAFLLCSGEKIEKKYFSEYNCFDATGHFVEDMYALSKCDYIFGVSSTYSLWASFMGNVPISIIDSKDFKVDEDNFFVCNGLELQEQMANKQ